MKNRTMNVMFTVVAAGTLASSALFAQTDAKPAAPAPAKAEAPKPAPTFESALSFLPDTVAEYGGNKLTKAQLIAELRAQIPAEALGQIPADQFKTIMKNIVESIVDKNILLSMAEKNGFKPSAELVKTTFDKMLKDLPADRLKMFEEMLKQQGKNMASYKEEMSKDTTAQKGIAINAWVEKNLKPAAEAKASDAEVEKFYRENQDQFKQPESVTASHILISVPQADKDGKALDAESVKKADAEALKKANDLLAQLKQGADFGKLAAKESDCPSKERNGELGTFGRGQMVKPFEDAVFAMQPGQLSEVVKTPFGYHIIKLMKKTPAGFRALPSVKDEIKNYLIQRNLDTEIKDMLAKEKAAQNVKIFGFDDVKTPAPAKAAEVGK